MKDLTDMGGPDIRFQSTRWTELIESGGRDETERREILGELLLRYWKPIYFYLRRKNYDSEAAKDLTQGFFSEIILEKQLLKKVDKHRGRFRNYLLRSLENYICSEEMKNRALKRRPQAGLVSLDHINPGEIADVTSNITLEDSFNYMWASEFLRMVCQDVENACRLNNLSLHWEVFNKRVLGPILDKQPPPSIDEICRELGIESKDRASNMIGVVKKRFRSTMAMHLRQLVDSPEQIDQEYNDLLAIFKKF